MNIRIKLTDRNDLRNVQALWATPAVMRFVGFPEGLHETLEHLVNNWLPWVQQPSLRRHYSVYAEEIGYCGEAFYDVDERGLACMDIKLLPAARGKGIAALALSHALDEAFLIGGANRAWVDPNPENTAALRLYARLGFRETVRAAHLEDPGCPYVYMEVNREDWQAWRGIRYRDIVLRDMVAADIEDEIRWNTVETEWALWDAPWEMEAELANFEPAAYREKELARLQRSKAVPRWSFELDTAEGEHIGSVSSYLIDAHWNWVQQPAPGQKVWRTLGIEINESCCWNHGYGARALTAFVCYLFSHGVRELCLQTWSGNVRMLRCAAKLGFVECNREVGKRHVRGGVYDGLTFSLDTAAFEQYRSEQERSAIWNFNLEAFC